jgi:uncharacterized protein (TIGR02186 family)
MAPPERRRDWHRARRIGIVALVLGLIAGLAIEAVAQRRPKDEPRRPRPQDEIVGPGLPQQPAKPVSPAEADGPPETIQADVSTRSVAVTSSFTGTQIVVFGAVDNSRQTSAEAGLYDVAIVLEGTPSRLVARRKSSVGGIWVNTQSVTFVTVPSYYAIASTRPLEEIASTNLLSEHEVGLKHVRLSPISGWETGLTTADLAEFKNAVIRLKQREGLYVNSEYSVAFIGRSLFRATIDLPANVPVGPLVGRVYLFREGRLLSTYTARVSLQREGIERFLHDFATRRPLAYGIFTVAVAVAAGLLASALLRRSSH